MQITDPTPQEELWAIIGIAVIVGVAVVLVLTLMFVNQGG